MFIPLDANTRAAAAQATEVVGEALEIGFLPAAPAKDECNWCDYETICGTNEERRAANKSQTKRGKLRRLREMK